MQTWNNTGHVQHASINTFWGRNLHACECSCYTTEYNLILHVVGCSPGTNIVRYGMTGTSLLQNILEINISSTSRWKVKSWDSVGARGNYKFNSVIQIVLVTVIGNDRMLRTHCFHLTHKGSWVSTLNPNPRIPRIINAVYPHRICTSPKH